MVEQEQWRIIDGFPNYRVSNLGRIQTNKIRWSQKSLTGEWKPLKTVVDTSTGYLVVNLSRPGQSRTFKVHTLVLEAFIGPRPDKMVACHQNGDKTDARLTNLRWDTYKANEQDKKTHGTYHHKAALTDEQVREIRVLLRSGTWRNVDIAAKYGTSRQIICDIKMGRAYSRVNDSWAERNGRTLSR